MTEIKNLSELRREYGQTPLSEETINPDPIVQFNLWFAEALAENCVDANAMVLSTVDSKGDPDSRVVLLKGVEGDHFIFFTNYESRKGEQLNGHPFAALNFFWPTLMRQIRIRGPVQRVTPEQSQRYFVTRPLLSQISASISPQSKIIPNRDYLEQAFKEAQQKHTSASFSCPKQWGGFYVRAQEIEFWQGQANRLHDRLLFCKENSQWVMQRLAP